MKIIDKVKNTIYRIKNRTVKLVKWAPILWKDEDYDHYYMWVILHRKLKDMEEFFTSDRAMALHAEKEAKKIKVCVTLLDRLMADDYDEDVFKKHHEKWGEPKFNWIEKDDDYSELIRQKNVKTEEDKKKEIKEFNKCCVKETQMRKQDIKYLFDMMNKHIECWWD